MNRILFFILLIVILPSWSQSGAPNGRWKVIYTDELVSSSSEVRLDISGSAFHMLCKTTSGALYHYYSNDEGKSWKKQIAGQSEHTEYESGEIASEIDASGNYHIAYFDPFENVVHAKWQTGSWLRDTLFRAPDEIPYYPVRKVTMGLTPAGELHYLIRLDENCWYIKGDKKTKIKLDAQLTSYIGTSFAFDKTGAAHVVVSNEEGQMTRYYSPDYGATWSREVLGDFRSDKRVDIAVDDKGILHVTFVKAYGFNQTSGTLPVCTYLAKNGSGTWEQTYLEMFPAGKYNTSPQSLYNNYPAIDIDEKGGVHVVYFPIDRQANMVLQDSMIYVYKKSPAHKFTFSKIPCAGVIYPGVEVVAYKDKVYSAYIGSPNQNSSGYGVSVAMFIPNEPEDSLEIEDRVIDVQAEVSLTSGTVTLNIWDNGEIDGDQLSVYLDGKVILEAYTLAKEYKSIPLKLEKGKTYYLSVVAVSEGEFPPCTAVVTINDGVAESTITLVSDTSKNGTLKLTVQ
jgi:hypothetical protein